jgi:hypothetical protein
MSFAKELLPRARDGGAYNGAWQAVISRPAQSEDDSVTVVIEAIDEKTTYGPALWQPRSDSLLPQIGDLALVIFDNFRTPYVIAWWPSQVAAMGDFRLEFEQASDDTVWTIIHNLDGHPSVTIVDANDNQIFTNFAVHYDDANQITVTFTTPTSGRAYLS